VDIRAERVYWWKPGAPSATSLHVGHSVSAVAPREAGGLLLASRSGFAILDDSGVFDVIADVEADLPENRMNDGKCDPRGRFWAGTMSESNRPRAGSLYRLDNDGSVTLVVGAVTISNGLDWSADEKIMYYVDSLAHGLDAFDFTAETGEVGTRRRVVDIPESLGLPDGITLDEQGFIWVALHGGNAVHRYSPEGLLERRIELPVSLVTSCSFGGPDLRDLYITSAIDPDRDEPLAGSIFCYRSDVGGRAGHLCKF
jgi:sugar lactone lactonase YvrE